ncbi:MAG: hypothetical protein US75_C0030G0003 [Candidatus Woesebacteria bacterium GW2011_GWC1_38_13]|uniref:dihydrofolate reductase n=1 Tax=Candidatus Woesebacteria bacterium GW2011_GWC1_38_13 TaxID=1618583 RepID=A0A0G0LRG5_9BACT|nr:MAG: hypothetical protein US75_C0030G0003 [Candidatus Woesebacteria bacterium GW2011_GWC1_38_13]
MIISIIAAVAENNVIGKKNSLPWNLPADLKHFQKITMGHCLIVGQNTHESIGKALPGRTNIILTFDKNYRSEGCLIVTSIEEALRVASAKNENEFFIIGGEFDGDVYFPEIDLNKWKLVSKEEHKKDDKNPYDYTFIVYEK